ncbi:hypothetical protein MDAP_000906 [Mitosporidium daphniae]
MSVFQHWIFYAVLPNDPTFACYGPSFGAAIRSTLCIECGFWTASLLFYQMKYGTIVRWLRSACSHILSSYLMFDNLLMSCISERLKVWCLSPGQLRASWEKTSTDPIVLFCHKFINGITCIKGITTSRVHVKEIKIMNRTLLLFYRTNVRYEKKNIIFWIPGGGFHALGPSDFLGVGSYLSKCAPVLIFDYPKSPENPYPEALLWIYNAIPLILDHFTQHQDKIFFKGEEFSSKQEMHQKPHGATEDANASVSSPWRGVIAGDSAGGNLATILATKMTHEPIPGLHVAGLALIYPLLSFEISGWLPQEDQEMRAKVAPHLVGEFASGGPFGSRFAIPSRLLNLNDKIIRTDILCYLAQSYLSTPKESIIDTNKFIVGKDPSFEKEIDPSDPSLTPLRLPSHMVQAIPRVFIQVGEMDPFLDDSLILFHKAIGSAPFTTKIRTDSDVTFNRIQGPSERVSLSLVEGVSHGYLLMQLLWRGFEPCMQEIETAIAAMFEQDLCEETPANMRNSGPEILPKIMVPAYSNLESELLRKEPN